MRILFFSSIFPQPGKPTRGIYCLRLCGGLSAAHQVKVLSPWSWLDRLRCGRSDRAAPKRLTEMDVEYPCYYYPPGILRSAYDWFMWHSTSRSIRRTLGEFAPDCVISYWAHPDGAVAVRAARAAGVPSLIILGGSDVLLLPHHRGRRRRVVASLQAADAVVTVSHYLKVKAVELGICPEKVHVVHQGIDRELFCPGDSQEARRRLGISSGNKMLVWVGNLVPVKGLEVLLGVCAALRDRGVVFRLYLIGDGPLRAALESRCRALALSPFVTFVGPRLHSQLPDWYRAADLTVLTSWSEGLPNVLRESLACGTPFVATDVGGVSEIGAMGSFNRLVPAGDVSAAAEAIAQSLRMPKPPATHFQPLSWPEYAEELLRILIPLVPASRKAQQTHDACALVG
jgi:glycosyltransferase involved in cell wall biosynthesis